MTPHDISKRDALLADQEALLNVYRCRFDIDIEQVPGGCAFGLPVEVTADPQTFRGTPDYEELAKRDALIVEQEALLNVYRCRFDIDTALVSNGCEAEAEVGVGDADASQTVDNASDADPELSDPPSEVGWHSFEGDRRHQPDLERIWQEGAYTNAVSWKNGPASAAPELRVACFDPGSNLKPFLRAYVAWNWFVTSRIDTYHLKVELPGGDTVRLDSINSTGNEASFVKNKDDIAEFTELLVTMDGEQISVSSFIPLGGYTISAIFDLTGSSTAIQPVLQECPPASDKPDGTLNPNP